MCLRSVMSTKVMTTPSTPVVLGAVRQDATDVPGAALSFDFSLDRREGLQHRSGIRQKSVIGCQRAEVCERPPDVAGNDIEERLWWPA